MSSSIIAKAAVVAAVLSATATKAAALPHWTGAHVPEIDGPAGVAAVALLVSAGILAYHRLRK